MRFTTFKVNIQLSHLH